MFVWNLQKDRNANSFFSNKKQKCRPIFIDMVELILFIKKQLKYSFSCVRIPSTGQSVWPLQTQNTKEMQKI